MAVGGLGWQVAGMGRGVTVSRPRQETDACADASLPRYRLCHDAVPTLTDAADVLVGHP